MVVPGGVISTNNQVWRQITFPAVTTTEIRIWIPFVAGTADPWSRIVEVEAWTAPPRHRGASVPRRGEASL